MLHTDIICVGKLKESYLRDAVAEYEKRLSAYMKLRIIEIKDEPTPDGASIGDNERIRKLEAERIAGYLEDRAAVIALAIEGMEYNSEGFAKLVEKASAKGLGHIQFLIGGSLGLSEELKKKAECVSFSRLTFPHQLTRVILLEQLYRGCKISRGEPYHK